VPVRIAFDYAIIRAVPRVERGEFVNIGVIVWCAPQRYLKSLISVSAEKLKALDPNVDIEAIEKAAQAIPTICGGGAAAGDLGQLSLSERFHWLVAPKSSSIQTSPVHMGRHENLDEALKKIFQEMVKK
jgi:hypothetical protein